MEPTDLVIEQLKAIRASIDANGERIDTSTDELRRLRSDVRANTDAIGGLTERMSNVEEAIVGYTAQITMFSRSLTVQMEARSRVEDKLDT
jgi:hypothetical protein